MKRVVYRAFVSIGLAFACVPLMSSAAQACKITLYAKPDTPLQDVPKRHSKSYYWQKFAYKLNGRSKFGPHPVGTSFIQAAKACGKYAVERKRDSNALYAVWEMAECNLVRVDEMSPAARKRWTGEVKQVCFILHRI